MSIKRKVFDIIETKDHTTASIVFEIIIIFLIILSVTSIVLESFDSLYTTYTSYFRWFELISVSIFSIEYILRLWTCNFKYPDSNPVMARVRFIFSTYGIIDLLAILPFYLPLIIKADLRFFRILRLFRLLRIFKLDRYTHSLELVSSVFKDKAPELLVTVFITFLTLLMSSALMYHFEHDAQPELFPNMAASFWWSIETLSTVGYGDIFPVTVAGKVVASFIALLGIAIIALPTGIISSAFVEKIQSNKANHNHKTCPHCGENLD